MERTIREVARETGYVCDPHTAVGIAAARRQHTDGIPVVTLATAHPAKFPDAVEAATGKRPHTPSRLEEKLGADERFDILENDYGALVAFIEARARVLTEPGT